MNPSDSTTQDAGNPGQSPSPANGEVVLDEIHRKYLGDVGGSFGLAGAAAIAFGIAHLLAAVLCIIAETLRGALAFSFSGLLALVLGILIRSASTSLRSAALRTEGQVSSVMASISEIRRVVLFEGILFLVGTVISALGIVAVLLSQR